MSQAPHVPQEVIGFRRSPALPGIEVVDADNSPREWRVACPTFAVVVFRTWSGPVRVGGNTLHGKPGVAFCNVPDELMVSRPDGDRPGSFNVIEIQREVLREWLAEQSGGTLPLQWAELMRPISPNLFGRFQRFFGAFAGGGSPLELQSELLELSEGMISDLIAGASPRAFQAGPPLRGTARMRECLTEEGFDLDLETLARKVGLSRFQALRAGARTSKAVLPVQPGSWTCPPPRVMKASQVVKIALTV